jgi:hypothetical protein
VLVRWRSIDTPFAVQVGERGLGPVAVRAIASRGLHGRAVASGPAEPACHRAPRLRAVTGRPQRGVIVQPAGISVPVLAADLAPERVALCHDELCVFSGLMSGSQPVPGAPG